MNKLSATTLATLLVAVAGATTSAYAADPKPEDYGVYVAPQTQVVQSREAVKAETQRARNEVRAENKAEDYGVYVAVEPAKSAPATAVAKRTRAADVRAEYNPADYGVFVAPQAKEVAPQYATAK
jgi:hypothetical protein